MAIMFVDTEEIILVGEGECTDSDKKEIQIIACIRMVDFIAGKKNAPTTSEYVDVADNGITWENSK